MIRFFGQLLFLLTHKQCVNTPSNTGPLTDELTYESFQSRQVSPKPLDYLRTAARNVRIQRSYDRYHKGA